MQHFNAGEVALLTRRTAKGELEESKVCERDIACIAEDITQILQDIFILFWSVT
jgi:hypothetical protein